MSLANPSTIYNQLEAEYALGSIIDAMTFGPPYTYTNGIANDHAYSILGVYTLSNGV